MKRRGGTVLFVFLSIAGLIRVMSERPVSAHYQLFTTAARWLWSGQCPYGVDFHLAGYWFYSPSCGLFLFGAFAFFPLLAGLFFYSLVSVVSYFFALRHFSKSIGVGERVLELVLALSSIPMYQALIAAKLETIIVAILFFATGEWLKKRYWSGALLFGMILDWKFQPAPMVGLLLLALLLERRVWIPVLWTGGAVMVWRTVPALVTGFPGLRSLLARQSQTLQAFVAEAYSNFDNFFHFSAAMGLHLSLGVGLLISLIAGLGMAIHVWVRFTRGKVFFSQVEACLGLGAWFCLLFSPLGQNNASILGGPFFFWTAGALLMKSDRRLKVFLVGSILASLFLYSDLVSESFRVWARTHSMKTLVLMIQGLVVAFLRLKGDLEGGSPESTWTATIAGSE